MLILAGITAIATLLIIFCIWLKGQINKNKSMSQQELNKNKVDTMMRRTKWLKLKRGSIIDRIKQAYKY